MRNITVLAFGALLLGGCVGGQLVGMKGSARRMCFDAGYQPGTKAYSDCWTEIRDKQFAAEAPYMGVGIAAGLAATGNLHSGPVAPIVVDDTAQRRASALGLTIAPNGRYVFGSPAVAPDGTWVAGTPQLAPDGTYVGGTPRLAPNGRYVGGSGAVLCPDGTYVGGRRCILAPDGTYVGSE